MRCGLAVPFIHTPLEMADIPRIGSEGQRMTSFTCLPSPYVLRKLSCMMLSVKLNQCGWVWVCVCVCVLNMWFSCQHGTSAHHLTFFQVANWSPFSFTVKDLDYNKKRSCICRLCSKGGMSAIEYALQAPANEHPLRQVLRQLWDLRCVCEVAFMRTLGLQRPTFV